MASGIELSESLAVGVREAQGRLLGRAQAGAQKVEGKFFADMRAQRKLEEEYRFLALQVRAWYGGGTVCVCRPAARHAVPCRVCAHAACACCLSGSPMNHARALPPPPPPPRTAPP